MSDTDMGLLDDICKRNSLRDVLGHLLDLVREDWEAYVECTDSDGAEKCHRAVKGLEYAQMMAHGVFERKE